MSHVDPFMIVICLNERGNKHWVAYNNSEPAQDVVDSAKFPSDWVEGVRIGAKEAHNCIKKEVLGWIVSY